MNKEKVLTRGLQMNAIRPVSAELHIYEHVPCQERLHHKWFTLLYEFRHLPRF
jgi:hypothetical protein